MSRDSISVRQRDSLVCLPLDYSCYIFAISVHSTIDHFVLSSGLSGSINKHCILEDLENRSDHVPLCIQLSLPIDINLLVESRQFEPKPKWHATTPTMICKYQHKLDELLSTITVSDDIINCQDVQCDRNYTILNHSMLL